MVFMDKNPGPSAEIFRFKEMLPKPEELAKELTSLKDIDPTGFLSKIARKYATIKNTEELLGRDLTKEEKADLIEKFEKTYSEEVSTKADTSKAATFETFAELIKRGVQPMTGPEGKIYTLRPNFFELKDKLKDNPNFMREELKSYHNRQILTDFLLGLDEDITFRYYRKSFKDQIKEGLDNEPQKFFVKHISKNEDGSMSVQAIAFVRI